MNIKEVLELPVKAKVIEKASKNIFTIEGTQENKFLVDDSIKKEITDIYSLQSIINMDFKEYSEEAKYSFNTYLTLSENYASQSNVVTKLNLKFVLNDFEIKSFSGLSHMGLTKEEVMNNYFTLKESLSILTCLLSEGQLRQALLSKKNFIIREY